MYFSDAQEFDNPVTAITVVKKHRLSNVDLVLVVYDRPSERDVVLSLLEVK
jgi:hypothetical protein